jgi:hypothetical protein
LEKIGTLTSKNKLLFIDITREGLIYTVEVYQRPSDPTNHYQLKITAKNEPLCTFKQNFQSLGTDSYNMRERIFNHLAILRSENSIRSVEFTDQKIKEQPASPPYQNKASKKSIVA